MIVFQNKKLCMEPPPDVTEGVASSVSAALAANGGITGGASATLGANGAAAISNSVANVNPTAQGIYIYRAVASNLCIELMNNEIKDTEYNRKLSAAASASFKLIAYELELTDGRIGPASKATSALDTEGITKTVTPVPAVPVTPPVGTPPVIQPDKAAPVVIAPVAAPVAPVPAPKPGTSTTSKTAKDERLTTLLDDIEKDLQILSPSKISTASP